MSRDPAAPEPPRGRVQRPPGAAPGVVPPVPGPARGLRGLPLALLTLLFAGLVLRAAWLCDDAYITFRTVENLATGEGARWNVDERVQAYTHPLWMLLLTGGRLLSGEVYASSLTLSLVLSISAWLLLLRAAARSPAGAVVAAVALLGSKAWIDYSTSGLEGPLVHLLVVLLALAWGLPSGPRRAFALACGSSLLFTARPDALPLVAPLVLAGVLAERRHPWALAAGALPLVAWLGCSLLYYGFPFPNTAYAKLSSGLPRSWLVTQGLHYLSSSLHLDPLTPAVIALALAVAAWKRERLALLLAGGLLLQVAYVVWVGGDFMSGRFLTAPLLAAALILARVLTPTAAALPAAAFLAALALATPRSPLRAPTAYGAMLDGSAPHDHIDARGVTDERAYWFHYTGLFSPARRDPERHHVTRGYPYGERLRAEGPGVRIVNGMGFVGYFAGPEPHLLDPMGLTDALLARLAVYRDGAFLVDQDVPAPMELEWRIGHFVRPVPAGYEATLASGESELASPALAVYWDDLRRVVREPLLAPGRLRSIARLNLGRGEELLERYLEERPEEPEGPLDSGEDAPGD